MADEGRREDRDPSFGLFNRFALSGMILLIFFLIFFNRLQN